MEKFFPPKPPIDMIVTPSVDKLLTLFGRNGYNKVAIALIVHDLEGNETALSGNLNMHGMETLLSSALNKVNADLATKEDGEQTH